MPQALCRCGQPLPVPKVGAESERITCPSCGAKVRVRLRKGPQAGTLPAPEAADGYIRFSCPCGKRLKMPAANPPSHGQCPDCGAVVPVPRPTPARPRLPPGHPETPTAEIPAAEFQALEHWVQGHLDRAASRPPDLSSTARIERPPVIPQDNEPPTKLSPARDEAPRIEAGLRICPGCGRPVHLGADACRSCGVAVPRR